MDKIIGESMQALDKSKVQVNTRDKASKSEF